MAQRFQLWRSLSYATFCSNGAAFFGFEEVSSCLAHFDPIQRNWFRTSRLATIVAIGLRKSYAKSESIANLVKYDVFDSLRCWFPILRTTESIVELRTKQNCGLQLRAFKNCTSAIFSYWYIHLRNFVLILPASCKLKGMFWKSWQTLSQTRSWVFTKHQHLHKTREAHDSCAPDMVPDDCAVQQAPGQQSGPDLRDQGAADHRALHSRGSPPIQVTGDTLSHA